METEKVSDERVQHVLNGGLWTGPEERVIAGEVKALRAERPALLAVVEAVANDLEWMTHGDDGKHRRSAANLRDCAARLRALSSLAPAAPAEKKPEVDETLGTQGVNGSYYMKCDDCGGEVNMFDGDTLLHNSGGLCLKRKAVEQKSDPMRTVSPHVSESAGIDTRPLEVRPMSAPASQPGAARGPTAEERLQAAAAGRTDTLSGRTQYIRLDVAADTLRAAVQAAEARVRKECGGDIRAAALHMLDVRAEKAEAALARLQGLRGGKDGEAERDARLALENVLCPIVHPNGVPGFGRCEPAKAFVDTLDAYLAAREAGR